MVQIYKGIDCCEDIARPGHLIHIVPASHQLKPGENVRLYADGYNIFECDAACLQWLIMIGGGRLSKEFGTETVYYAPDKNDECQANAIVGLRCGGRIIDECPISTNAYTREDPAFRRSTFEPIIYYYQPEAFPFYPPDIEPPKDAEGANLRIRFDWRYFDCDSQFLYTRPRMTLSFLWEYRAPGPRWYLRYTASSTIFGVHKSIEDIPLDKIKDRFPLVEDLRTKTMKEKGCCPILFWREEAS